MVGVPNPEELYDQHTSDVYRDAIADLRGAWIFSQSPGNELAALFLWPLVTSDEFISFLTDERRPRALVVFAHYCAMVLQMPRLWWSRDDGAEDILKIANLLGNEWLHWMDLPLSFLTTNSAFV
jgi:hypothetical protein